MASARLTEVDPRRELGDFKGRYPQLGDDELLLTGRGWRTSPRTRAEHDQQADTPGGMDIVIPDLGCPEAARHQAYPSI
jgi:hypothetical protein